MKMAPLQKLIVGTFIVLALTLVIGSAFLFPALAARGRFMADASCSDVTPRSAKPAAEGSCTSVPALVTGKYRRDLGRGRSDLHVTFAQTGISRDVALGLSSAAAWQQSQSGQSVRVIYFQGQPVWLASGLALVQTAANPNFIVFKTMLALAIALTVELIVVVVALIALLTRRR